MKTRIPETGEPRAPETGSGLSVICEGIGAAPGIVIGPLFPITSGAIHVPRYEIHPEDREEELQRLSAAIDVSLEQIATLRAEVIESAGSVASEVGELLDVHSHMLSGSRLVRRTVELVEAGSNAEAAVEDAIEEIAAQYKAITNAYLAGRIDDVHEVGNRLIRNLVQAPQPRFSNIPEGAIVVAHDITPADAALMEPSCIGGFAATLGGAEGHTAIMARSLGIPAMLGASGLMAHARRGDLAILDGGHGRIIFNPTDAEIADYHKRQARLKQAEARLARLRSLPAVTRDKVSVTLKANIELPIEVGMAIRHGAEGIGLVRTEFMFMNRDRLPGEQEQFEELLAIVKGMEGRSVTIRTLDVGGEKFSAHFRDTFGEASANPALGLRAIRFSLKYRDMFVAQIRAILRVAGAAPGEVRILLPMITRVREVQTVRKLIEEQFEVLKAEGATVPDLLPPIGVMIEVPAAALSADALAQVSDFFSIGTNDLTMYTLAIDRADDQVAGLYDPLHPAVLRLIQFTVNAGQANGIPVNVCGEMAGDARIVPLLVGLGIGELSMAATSIPRAKARIRRLSAAEARSRAETIMQLSDRTRIQAVLDDFNELA